MSSFEDERLRILARVSAGELTSREGSLEIAMAKVRAGDGAAPDEDAHQAPRARQPLPPLPQQPNRNALLALLAVPILAMGAVLTVGMAFFLALPAYVVMAGWNGLVVPSAPGAVEIGFFPTLAALVFASMVSTGLRWRRRIKVFMSGQAQPGVPFGFSARWPAEDGPFVPEGTLGHGNGPRD